MKQIFKKILSFTLVFAISATTLVQTTYANQGLLEGKVIILDAGHGDGVNTYMGYSEGTTMRIITQKLIPLLESEGATVYEIRPDEYDIPLATRTAMINKISLEYLISVKNATKVDVNYSQLIQIDRDIVRMRELIACMDEIIDDVSNASKYLNYPYSSENPISKELTEIFEYQNDPYIAKNMFMISLHSNAASSTSADGGLVLFEPFNTTDGNTYYYNDYAHVTQETVFANLILGEFEEIGFRNGGYRAQNLHLTRENNLPAALVECGFHTNDADREKLTGDENLDLIARAYFRAIVNYYAFDFGIDVTDYDLSLELDKIKTIIDYSKAIAHLISGNYTGFIGNFTDALTK